MNLLDRLDDTARARFLEAGVDLTLDPGAYLCRRGEPGGDLFVLAEGQLEVVDQRGGERAILAVLDPGAVVGEVSFLDDSPRTADVVARGSTRVLRWSPDELRALLGREPAIAAVFFEGIGHTLAGRMRTVSRERHAPRVSEFAASTHDGTEGLRSLAGELAERLETADHAGDGATLADDVQDALDTFLDELAELFARLDADGRDRAVTRLLRPLRTWWRRSHLGAALLAREDGRPALDVDVFEHALAGRPRGVGAVGHALDAWLLHRPSPLARREVERDAALLLSRHVEAHPRPRVLLLDTPCPTRLAWIAERLQGREAELVLVDDHRALLQAGADQLASVPGLTVLTVQESLVRLALGRASGRLPTADVVLMLDVPSYLPDRLALPLLEHGGHLLSDDGRLLVSGVDRSHDEALWSPLLRWPTIRREARAVERLAGRAGLRVAERATPTPPGWLLGLTRTS